MDLPARVVLATDHAGYSLKEELKEYLTQKGVDIVDTSPVLDEDDDYPPTIRKGCAAVLEYGCPGIVLGGSGNGEAMVANKVKGIRCALCYSRETAELARMHNDANVMSLGARMIDTDLAKELVDIFLTTDFAGGRHKARVDDLELTS